MPANGNSFVKDEATGYLTPTHTSGTTPFGVESKQRFLKLMEQEGNLGKVCDILGVSLTTYYHHLELDEAFARDVTIALRKMANNLEGVMYKNGQRPQGYMDRITWLRRWFPEWNPKSQVTVASDSTNIDDLFDRLKEQGKLIDIEPDSKI